jgi:hypothetical protein
MTPILPMSHGPQSPNGLLAQWRYMRVLPSIRSPALSGPPLTPPSPLPRAMAILDSPRPARSRTRFLLPTRDADLQRTTFQLDVEHLRRYRDFAGDGFFRLSIGLEDPLDLCRDLDQALHASQPVLDEGA